MAFNYHRKFLLLAPVLACVPMAACGSDDETGAGGQGGVAPPTSSSSMSTGGGSGVGGDGGGSVEHVVWPEAQSDVPLDPEIEAAVAELLATMTLEQKVGQMVQTEIPSATPEEAGQYHLGSVLNGGGSWPDGNKAATAADWSALADAYYTASMADLGIPIIWGTDAVHGQNKMGSATIFPHNIGLGATRDPDLIQRIGEITAIEVAVNGLDWIFGPVLATARDDRWGRTYESYSEDPSVVKEYAGRMVEGLQGSGTTLFDKDHLIGTAKHYLGDGGTKFGVDQGVNEASEAELRDIHAVGYPPAITAGVQTVMASYSSALGQKMHGNKYLLTDVLKGRFHFDGFVIGDWSGHDQIPGCNPEHCPEAINAGVDMFMAPYKDVGKDWKQLIANTIQDVKDGIIPQARIDDAVTRILRVKMRAGLFGPRASADKGLPSTRPLANQTALLGAPEHRAVAREAVQKSLVLLKNKDGLLPLSKAANVLVAGKTANNIGNQCGGWTLDWQGATNVNSDFSGATSIFDGIRAAVTAGGGTATLSEDGAEASPANDVVIAVVGETPYAEFMGDIGKTEVRTMEHALLHPEDLALLDNLKANAPGVPIVTVFVSGRPLYVNKELNRSSAFVAAWLPGTEGGGVADVLFGDVQFTGKLSFSWPLADCQTLINNGDGQTPLFPFGFGLAATDTDTLADDLEEKSTAGGCDGP
jgi:beta-glucosidase